jgi:hypothetical protein
MEKAMPKSIRWYLSYSDTNITGCFMVSETTTEEEIQKEVNKQAVQDLPIEYKNRDYSITWDYFESKSIAP